MRQPWNAIPLVALAVLSLVTGPLEARESPKAEFKYAAGTAVLPRDCEGSLELTSAVMTFQCASGSVAIPYAEITLMQYRSDVSQQVRKLKLPWKVKPYAGRSKHNRYFTVVYTEEGAARALVLFALPRAMRPYLAEIDLKAGRRIEVQPHGDY